MTENYKSPREDVKGIPIGVNLTSGEVVYLHPEALKDDRTLPEKLRAPAEFREGARRGAASIGLVLLDLPEDEWIDRAAEMADRMDYPLGHGKSSGVRNEQQNEEPLPPAA